MKTSHKARFEKWQRLCPERSRALSSLVRSQLVPRLEREGFGMVDVSLRDPRQPVSGKEIEMERWHVAHVDSVTFNFDKYLAPRFQVHASRRSVDPPHAFMQSANLVARPSQYLHFWGKPWWMPNVAWSTSAPLRTILGVEEILPQLLHFLATGQRGRNISRAVELRGGA